MNGTIGVFIIDSHASVRAGLRALIATEPDMHVVGETGDAALVTELVQLLQPDVIIIDLVLPSAQGSEVIRHLRAHYPQGHILVLTDAAEEKDVVAALRAGAQGYYLKDGLLEDVIGAIRDVYQGKATLHPTVAPAIYRAIRQMAGPSDRREVP